LTLLFSLVPGSLAAREILKVLAAAAANSFFPCYLQLFANAQVLENQASKELVRAHTNTSAESRKRLRKK